MALGGFAGVCAELGVEHRLTPPKSPQTNGMVERFNGRIEEVLQSHHFRSGEELETTLHRYVWLYNQQLPQSALGSKSPLQAMKDWHKLNPQLFRKQPYFLPGCDTYPIFLFTIFVYHNVDFQRRLDRVMINRTELGRYFDSVLEDVKTSRNTELEITDYWLTKLEMKINELRRLSLLCATSIHPCSDAARFEGHVPKTWEAAYDSILQIIFRSLSTYSPKGIDAWRAAKIITDLVKSIEGIDDPTAVCELASFRYCNIFGIDICDSDAIYLEIVIRESLGLFGDIPPTPAEQTKAFRVATDALHALWGSSKPRFGVVRKRVQAA